MKSSESAVTQRISTLKTVWGNASQKRIVEKALRESAGDWAQALPALQKRLPELAITKLKLANDIAEWSDDHVPIVEALTKNPKITSLRDVATRYGVTQLTALVKAHGQYPEEHEAGATEARAQQTAIHLRRGLYAFEPTAVLHRMVIDDEVPIGDATVRSGVAAFLDNQPDFDMRTTSLYAAFDRPQAFEGVAEEVKPAVVDNLKVLQRVQAISPVPEAVPVLMSAQLTSGFEVAQVPESTFVSGFGATLGEDIARQVYTTAIDTHIRNENALAGMRDIVRGSGLAVIDGASTLEHRLTTFTRIAETTHNPINLHDLFGDIDRCECDDCLSIYSPAAYFVELLQFLRNNNLDPDPKSPLKPKTDPKDISGTPLEMLFRRRPDLKCLELTCENTFTVLPYIDLANEVMESFVVHLDEYATDSQNPKQITLDVFNVGDETTPELLAQPQHINYQAYCTLKNAVYPFTLPYHQPIDVARIWLPALGTSRHELLETFRTATETCDSAELSETEQVELDRLHTAVYERATDAEYLNITQEEYIILTQQAFWGKRYFELTTRTSYTDDEYRQKIGVKDTCEYYGYADDADMLDVDETGSHMGLTFVAEQFLPRTGIHYPDLVDIVRTRFVNPSLPTGHALTLTDSIAFSYRFLQTLVDTTSKDPGTRYAKLVEFLQAPTSLVPEIDAILHPDPCQGLDPCHDHPPCGCRSADDFTNWVYCYFERIGRLIVLESHDKHLPIEGAIAGKGIKEDAFAVRGRLHHDGTITDPSGTSVIGHVDDAGVVVGPITEYSHLRLFDPLTRHQIGRIDEHGAIFDHTGTRIGWSVPDTCDLDKVRLTHLDGSPLTTEEYDRIHRFLRLWRRLGWTIGEADQALVALSSRPGSSEDGAEECGFVGFDTFHDSCGTTADSLCSGTSSPTTNCPDIPEPPEDISPTTIHHLAAIGHVLDTTGLDLDKALALWGDIGTTGDKPLYARIFLIHNVLGIDPVFRSDSNGNYLTGSIKLSEHLPVVMAALKLKAPDIDAIIADRDLSDALTLPTVSMLYRYALMAGLLHVRVTELPQITALLGDPFTDPQATQEFLHTWNDTQDAGFTYRQLNYIIRDRDDTLRPVGPSKRDVLQFSKTLYDGLTAITHDHPDVPTNDATAATDDLVRASTTLLYEPAIVDGILGLLNGTTVHTTNAPSGLTVALPADLALRVKYSSQDKAQPPTATIQVTGILPETDLAAAKSLSTHPGWARALDRVQKQAGQFFRSVLGIFPADGELGKVVLAGDDNPPPDPSNPADTGTAPTKRLAFLTGFLPYLRSVLAHKLIIETASNTVGLPPDTTDLLLTKILRAGSGQSALNELQTIAQLSPDGAAEWRGYLIPSVSSEYTIVVVGADTQPPPVTLAGLRIGFPHQQDDPSNVWSSDPIALTAGALHHIELGGVKLAQLHWKTPTTLPATIPTSALLPDHSTTSTAAVLAQLTKAALLVNGFTLATKETAYLHAHAADFDGLDFGVTTLTQWRRLHAYTALRDSITGPTSTLIDLFEWASGTSPTPAPAALAKRITASTGWDATSVATLLTPKHLDLSEPAAFRNETNLVTLRNAIGIASRSSVTIDRLLTWAAPTTSFWPTHAVATDIQAALRARYTQSDWEHVVKPLYDQLRSNQRDALIAYLIVQPALREWGVIDADSLFEFFLIDVQMGACLDTSRIKQAISTVQSFVQRCLLGLEEHRGVKAEVLDRKRWDWMQKYRVWEANRKVYSYPENWTKVDLRDDASPQFQELQSELLQKDINPTTIHDALHNYVFKFDEVANLQIIGLFVDEAANTLHVFGRTRNAPYSFYYRHYNTDTKYWYPWKEVNVDVTSYDVDFKDADGTPALFRPNGAYLTPVVWNNRLLIFFPQFRRKSDPPPRQGDPNFQEIGNAPASKQQSVVYWEIAMAWSEYRNGKWLPKQVSTGALADPHTPTSSLPPVDLYEFVPRLMAEPTPKIGIDTYFNSGIAARSVGGFEFSGSHITAVKAASVPTSDVPATLFHTIPITTPPQLHSQQGVGTTPPKYASQDAKPYFGITTTSVDFTDSSGATQRASDGFAHQLISALATGTVDGLFDFYRTEVTTQADKTDVYGGVDAANTSYHELARPNALYHWETGFHAQMLFVDRLLAAGQFDLALATIHRILNPFAKGTADDPVWGFLPFREANPENDLQTLLLALKPNTPDPAITEWRENPFQPHVIARRRPGAYMRWVAMTYIRIWIAYGDYYFRQNTLETLPLAIQCYIVASHVYGPRGETIPKRGKTVPQTYASLLDKWDAHSNAMVEMELLFPFSHQTPLPSGNSNGVTGLANIFGFATTSYFCIPDNPELTALRDTIDDRLFKIRHCQDINGIERKLPLFEPPIDPALLVQAAAHGLSLTTVLNDLNVPMPNYRFVYLLQKALELCAELKTLGNAFLSAKEKHDAEGMALLRAGHETKINTLVMEVRKHQAEEASRSLAALQENRKGPVYRLEHHLKLVGGDMSAVPTDEQSEFTELPEQIEPPIDDSGLKLISLEKAEMDNASDAHDEQSTVGQVETLASALHAIPLVAADVKPIGVGTGFAWGGSNLGNAAQAVARGLQIHANTLSFRSSNAARKATFTRQLQERTQAANVAGYEISNIDKQILTQQIRMAISDQEIANQQQQIDNAQAVEDFLRNKYTNAELYGYMDTQVRALYYQTYTLAYDLAKKAERLFQFERGTTSDFVKFGYWDPARDGLLAGENLYNGLKKLEAAYHDKRGYDFEVTKHISLRQLDPQALLALRETGHCEFVVPEVLFDIDYPGHYQRRIKSVTVTVPAVVGPYTSVNCTLRLLENAYRNSPLVPNKNDYPRKSDSDDERFTTVNVPITAIAVSTGQNDAGVFELNFRDERYLPFEGAGVITRWRLELPKEFRQFDYDTITDCIMQMRYTALDGGTQVAQAATESVQKFVTHVEDLSRTEGLFAAFDLRHDFPNEWHKATRHNPSVLVLPNLIQRLPYFARGHAPDNVQATDVYIYTSAEHAPTSVTLTQGDNDTTLSPGPLIDNRVATFNATELANMPIHTWQIGFHGDKLDLDELWLIVRYILT
ncbi:neuraminidase-like domain-containing protein [Rhodococcus aetherivorans]|uniref:Tc toxin subunit A-related protein n=1 Tax=Rhodococcus aetherivorans TaxID=191292 RepID=UPI0036B73A5A